MVLIDKTLPTLDILPLILAVPLKLCPHKVLAVANLVGVYVVKFFEEKSRKDKLWKVEATVPYDEYETVDFNLTNLYLPHNYILLGEKYAIFNIYCATQKDSEFAKKVLDKFNAKYFVSEAKTSVL